MCPNTITRRTGDATTVLLEGPYGCPSIDIEGPRYKAFVLVAGGIGVTPICCPSPPTSWTSGPEAGRWPSSTSCGLCGTPQCSRPCGIRRRRRTRSGLEDERLASELDELPLPSHDCTRMPQNRGPATWCRGQAVADFLWLRDCVRLICRPSRTAPGRASCKTRSGDQT